MGFLKFLLKICRKFAGNLPKTCAGLAWRFPAPCGMLETQGGGKIQNYPYIMPMYQPQGYRYQQPPVMQPQANVDWVQVAGFEAAKAQQVEPGKTCWMRDTKKHPKIKKKC